MAQNFTTDVTQWQGVDEEPTAGSENLVESWGIKIELDNNKREIDNVNSEIYGGNIKSKFSFPEPFETINVDDTNPSNSIKNKIFYKNGLLYWNTYGNWKGNASSLINAAGIDPTDEDSWMPIDWNNNKDIHFKFKATVININSNINPFLRIAWEQEPSASGWGGYNIDLLEGFHEYDINISELMRNNQSRYTTFIYCGVFNIDSNRLSTNEDLDNISIIAEGFYYTVSVSKGIQERTIELEEKTEELEDCILSYISPSNGNALAIRNLIPSYYTEKPENPTSYDNDSYIDTKISKVPEGKRFGFITDTHWDWGTNAQKSPILVNYVKEMLGLKTFIFGGDFINAQVASNGKYLAKQVLSDFAGKIRAAIGCEFLPVMGNHDTNLAGVTTEDYTPEYHEANYLPCYVTYDYLFKDT